MNLTVREISGHTNSGKTKKAVELACGHLRSKEKVVHISFDENSLHIAQRYLHQLSGVPLNKVLNTDLSPGESKRIEESVETAHDILSVRESFDEDRSIDGLIRNVKSLHASNTFNVLVIDSNGHIARRDGSSELVDHSELIERLGALSSELQIHIITTKNVGISFKMRR